MRRHLRRQTLTVVMSLMVAGCCGSYKGAVKTAASKMPNTAKFFYEECVAKTCGGLTPELAGQHIITDAALACLVDSDEGKSKPEAKSPACSCSEGTDINACKPWLGIQ